MQSMNFYHHLSFTIPLLILFCPTANAEKPTSQSVKSLGQKVVDWQIRTFKEHGKYRGQNGKEWSNDQNYHDLEWQMAALYIGMERWRHIADTPTTYTAWLKEIGNRNQWQLHRRPYDADDHAVGQLYLSLFEEFQDPKMLKPTQTHFDWILKNPKTGTLDRRPEAKAQRTHKLRDRWSWCDALFMAPPAWARLAKITGERKYLQFMDQEYQATYNLLWSTKDKFFWRDTAYFERHEKNGKNLFWSRGNGWGFGGLALMIPDLPKDWEGRDFYLNLYKEMAHSIKNSQRPDGTWSMGILGDLTDYPTKETSGTSFFTFGLAWGINNGLLDQAAHEPIVLKAWNALEQCVTPDGMLTFVQPVGAAPGKAFPDKTKVYGTGAFLAATSEVFNLLNRSK